MSKKKKNKTKMVTDARPKEFLPAKVDAKTAINKTADEMRGLLTTDAFTNNLARVGFGQPNLLEGTSYPITRMSYNYTLFSSLYRSSWIVRKIIDVVPSDMMKNWIRVHASVDPAGLRAFNRTIALTQTKEKILRGLQWGRLYGGAAGLILLKGQGDPDTLATPLDLRTIMPGDYQGLLVYDRWAGFVPDAKQIDDIMNPDYGLPEFYTLSTGDDMTTARTYKIHHSRIVRFPGRELPHWEKIAEQYWGESEIEIIYEELKKRDNTSYNIASLIYLANIRVLKMDDLGQLLATADPQQQRHLYDVLSAQNHLMSNMGLYVMDKEDEFDTKTYSFTGLNDVYESFQLDIAGAAEMPVTKLFGRAPAGLNATGENDLTQYDESIEEKQKAYLQPVLNKLLPVIATSAWGFIPDDFDWAFNPVRNLSDKDRVAVGKTLIDGVATLFDSGIISQQTALKELKQQEAVTGLFGGSITDEDIANADPDVYKPDMEIGETEIEEEVDEGPSWMSRLQEKIRSGGYR